MHLALHSALGICLWNLLAVLVLAVAVVILAVHFARQKQRKAALESAHAAAAGSAPGSGK